MIKDTEHKLRRCDGVDIKLLDVADDGESWRPDHEARFIEGVPQQVVLQGQEVVR